MTDFKSYEYNKKYNEKYLAKLVKPTIRMTPEEKEIIEQGAEKAGKSFTRFMVDCALKAAEELTDKGE